MEGRSLKEIEHQLQTLKTGEDKEIVNEQSKKYHPISQEILMIVPKFKMVTPMRKFGNGVA
eukprot:9186320-Ditylum_brightwellii.AAC.1